MSCHRTGSLLLVPRFLSYWQHKCDGAVVFPFVDFCTFIIESFRVHCISLSFNDNLPFIIYPLNQIIETKQKRKNTSCPCRSYHLMLSAVGSWFFFFTFGKARIVKYGFFQEWIGNFSVYSLKIERIFYIETKRVWFVPKILLLPIPKILQWMIRRVMSTILGNLLKTIMSSNWAAHLLLPV